MQGLSRYYHVADWLLKSEISFAIKRERERHRRERKRDEVQLLRTGRIHACSRSEHLTGFKYLFVVVVREYASCNKMHFVLDDKFLRNDDERFAGGFYLLAEG